MGYILFSSTSDIYLCCAKAWNGIIEYSYNNQIWKEWYGEEITNNKIYIRGINNTVVSDGFIWGIKGKNVKCQGNIENLLDYKSVINNIHPKMESECFSFMFAGRSSLIEAPQLSAVNISNDCYKYMFHETASLIISPMFPNLQIAKEAIINQHMLDECSIQFININNKLYDINVLKLL